MSSTTINELLVHMERERISLVSMVNAVLSHQARYAPHPFPFLLNDLIARTTETHLAFFNRDECVSSTVEWAHDFMVRRYSEALQRLAHQCFELHFGVMGTEPWQLKDFRLEDVAAIVWKREPLLWSLVYRLVTGDLTGTHEEPLAFGGERDSDNGVVDADSDEGAQEEEDEDFVWRRDNSTKVRAFHEIVSIIHSSNNMCH